MTITAGTTVASASTPSAQGIGDDRGEERRWGEATTLLGDCSGALWSPSWTLALCVGDRVDFTSGDLTCFISCSASNCLAFSFTVSLGPLIFWKRGLLTSSLLSGFSAPSSLAVSLCCCHWMGSMITGLPRDPDMCLLVR